ncbi:DUF4394 domain-containing protein [Aeoliella sp. SH292]|jgi:hypothetical protein|uniref:DUF4394 domain-containing protein n=1 Tax=Aeoliella sp. SH292 TaxID=3454464 RepID=UPI003F982F92
MVWGVQLTNRIEGEKSLVAMDPYREVVISSTKLIGGTTIETLALDPTDGTFYGASSTTLFTIDPVLGGVTPVGALSHDVSFGLAFDLAGNLYGTSPGGELVAVDKQLASSSLLGLTTTPLVDLAARPEDGVMYGLGRNGILYKVDLQSGALTQVGASIFRGSSLAFSVVPEPSTCGLLAVGMLGLALRRMAHSACPVPIGTGG